MNDERKKLLDERDNLSPGQLEKLSDAACSNLLQIEEVCQVKTVMFYASFRSEVDTFPLMKRVMKRDISVALPVTKHREKVLDPRLVKSLEDDLLPGYCSIMEPQESRTEKIDVSEIDTVIVPGSVFDLEGGRLGYGGGFYDRFLVRPECRAIRVGLCFELQVIEQLLLEPHDQKMDVLVTEKEIYRF